jgi:hypothetical protein
MDAETWGAFQTLASPPLTFGESASLRVELLCTRASVLGRSLDTRHLGAPNALADALDLPRSVVRTLLVERVVGDRDAAAVLESDVGALAYEVPEGARPREILTREADRGRRQIMVPDGSRPGSIFVAPRLIDGARVDVDVVAVEVPMGFEGGDMVSVRAVGGHVTAVVPDGAKPGQIFMQEYHPQRTSSPEIRVTFEIDQPRYSVDGWKMGSGAAQYPLYAMENEMKHRLNTRGCGLVTHMSIERVGSGDAGGWADTDGATLRLWRAAEAGDVQSVRQELEQLEAAGLLGRGAAGDAGPVNKPGPVSESFIDEPDSICSWPASSPLPGMPLLLSSELNLTLGTALLQVSGSTALHLAARWGHVEVLMELLLHGGADASLADGNGRTAEEIAVGYRRLRAAVCFLSLLYFAAARPCVADSCCAPLCCAARDGPLSGIHVTHARCLGICGALRDALAYNT